MQVRFNKDRKTVNDIMGKTYKINGLLIEKPKSADIIYELKHPICQAVIFPGLTSQAIDLGNGKVNLL